MVSYNKIASLVQKYEELVTMCSDNNQTIIYVASNLVFHEWTKHIEVGYCFVGDFVMNWTFFIKSENKLVDIIKKPRATTLITS